MTRILLVDDDEAIREVLKLRPNQWGYQVDVAEHGSKAQELLLSKVIDTIICDVVLPD
jgi:DNA-binding response OmpR family regulator